jgi:hypothetical protein
VQAIEVMLTCVRGCQVSEAGGVFVAIPRHTSVQATIYQRSTLTRGNNTYQVSQLLYSILVYIHGMKDVYIIFQAGLEILSL